MPKYARSDDDPVEFTTTSRSRNGYRITVEVARDNVMFYVEGGFAFAVKATDDVWDDFVTIVNYIDQVVLKTKE